MSRRHAAIEYRDDGFYIIDFKSKFGTLVLTSDNIEIPTDHNLTVQVGRTIVTSKPTPKSKIPDNIPPEDHLIPNNNIYRTENDQVKFDEGYQDTNYKVIEINGRRFLVKPENEMEDQSKKSKFSKFKQKS